AVAGVGHQHAIAAGERQIGRQRSALVPALFLDDLDQQHLAALDHVLDLVAAAQRLAFLPQLVGGGFVDRRAVRFSPELGRFFGSAIVVRDDVLVVRPVVTGVVIIAVGLGLAQTLFLGGVLGFLAQQRFAVGLGDLVVIGMDFAEGEEAV